MPDTSFRFPCYSRLKQTLGKIDAITECTELAVRDFALRAKAGDPVAFIKELSVQHGIKVDHVQLDKLLVRLAQLHVVSVYQIAEQVFEEFRDEYPGSGGWKYDNADGVLRSIIKNVLGNYDQGRKLIGTLEVELVEHYRLVRNRFMHTEINEKRVDVKAVELQPLVKISQEYCKLRAPSAYDEMVFDDFILYTRALKHLVKRLCIISRPNDEIVSQMVQDSSRKENDGINLRKLRKFKEGKGGIDRMRNAIATILLRNYALEKKEASPIVDRVLIGLLA